MSATTRARLRDLLLPREHGGWSLAFEPVALGLFAAPTLAGVALATAAAAVFLARRPAQFAAGHFGNAHRRAAAYLLGALALAALTALAIAAHLGNWSALWPLLLGVPPAALFVILDTRGESRAAVPELAGAAAFAVIPAACATLAGFAWPAALSLAALMFLRSLPAVLVVRTFLRRRKGQRISTVPALLVSVAAAVGVVALALPGHATLVALAAAMLLLLRAVWLLGPLAPPLRASQLGALESALGLGFVVAVGLS